MKRILSISFILGVGGNFAFGQTPPVCTGIGSTSDQIRCVEQKADAAAASQATADGTKSALVTVNAGIAALQSTVADLQKQVATLNGAAIKVGEKIRLQWDGKQICFQPTESVKGHVYTGVPCGDAGVTKWIVLR